METTIKFCIVTAILSIIFMSLIHYNYVTDKNAQTLLPITYTEEAEITTGGGNEEINTIKNSGKAICPVLGE